MAAAGRHGRLARGARGPEEQSGEGETAVHAGTLAVLGGETSNIPSTAQRATQLHAGRLKSPIAARANDLHDRLGRDGNEDVFKSSWVTFSR